MLPMLASFSVEGQGSRSLPQSSWCVHRCRLAIEKCRMLASFLRCHSTTETLNLTVEVSTRGAYVRGKNTSAILCAKNAGGAYARGGAYLWDTTVLLDHCSLPLLLRISISCYVWVIYTPI